MKSVKTIKKLVFVSSVLLFMLTAWSVGERLYWFVQYANMVDWNVFYGNVFDSFTLPIIVQVLTQILTFALIIVLNFVIFNKEIEVSIEKFIIKTQKLKEDRRQSKKEKLQSKLEKLK